MSKVIVRSQPQRVKIVASGPPRGERGPSVWVKLTQAEYDQLDPPDPDTMYVIID